MPVRIDHRGFAEETGVSPSRTAPLPDECLNVDVFGLMATATASSKAEAKAL
jgi:hypothetical protein